MAKKRSNLNANGTAPVEFTRTEVSNMLPAYFMIRDVIAGEQAIKGIIGGPSTNVSVVAANGGAPLIIDNIMLTRAKRYLPQPNAEDLSQANIERYRAYVIRAVFYNVTDRTLEGMAGQLFLRDPQVKLPPEVEILKLNSDGGGLTLDQSAYRTVRHVISYGRAGILVDFPVQDGPVTKADIAKGDIQPTITIYNPWDIINWRTEQRGSKKVLTLVTLREVIDEEGDDGFQLTTMEQYRVLKLDKTGTHVVEVYKKQSKGFSSVPDATYNPTDASGKPLTEIPFKFIGSENNEPSPNKPPLYNLASVNIAHYRNSADYEESCFIVGQATPVLSGLTQDWVDNVLKGHVTFGSRAAIQLPVGGKAELLQAAENSLPFEAMKHKEDQMVAIGAKLVQLQRKSSSATEKIIETTSESSLLMNVSLNVSQAFEWAISIATGFLSKAKAEVKYQLNRDFDLTSMTSDDQNALIKEWQSAALSFKEMRAGLRKAGIATQTDEEARADIQKDIDDGLIPDPTLLNAPPAAPGANPPKAPSNAGGPQPGPRSRKSRPS